MMPKRSSSTLVVLFALVTLQVEAYGRIPEGGECLHPSGVTGICSKVSDCPGGFEAVTTLPVRSPVCSFQGRIAIVCCAVHGVKSVAACETLEERLPNLGVSSISNGVLVRKKFPHMALLGYINQDSDPDLDPDWRCGGSLISEKFVLTAAHCIVTKFGNVSKVLLGANNLSQRSGNEKYFNIDSIIVHSNYTPQAWYNDIALIKLAGKVKLSSNIYPACLYTKSNEPNSLIVSGWGQTGPNSPRSNVLLEGKNELKPVSSPDCTERYIRRGSVANSVPNGITSTMFCATNDSPEISSDTCGGDSGGPIQLRKLIKDGTTEYVMYDVVGVTSGGALCGGEPPGVYTRVYYYLEWIESIIYQN